MARLIHPDRVECREKDEFTEKFKILQKVHAVLTDVNKRRHYDETGTVENVDGPRVFIVSDDQMNASRKNYIGENILVCHSVCLTDRFSLLQGSEREKQAIQEAYTSSNGRIQIAMKKIPFVLATDKHRVAAAIHGNVHFHFWFLSQCV